ncbi:hypothetical protein NPIL_607861 [Nephila pilipes]|uniref:Uncharacterized protein n=1 Tax=Nephila pilipes TaxID=299642 RepID=A0A8X6JZJ4_NEPPI|nr:hypothetical protein NPIL_607861 [Nephila pilipes]
MGRWMSEAPLFRPGRTVPGADVTALRSPPPSFPMTSHRTPSHLYKGLQSRKSSVSSRNPLSLKMATTENKEHEQDSSASIESYRKRS